MGQRFTVKDVRTAFGGAAKAAAAAGLDVTGWHLQEGSKMNGIAYRIFRREAGTGGLRDLGFTSGNGYLGMTAREAHDSLRCYQGAWWAVADLKRQESEND